MTRRLVTATMFTAIAAGPALAADFDFDITDVRGFRHWDHTHGGGVVHHTPHAHRTQVAQHARVAVSPPPLPPTPPAPPKGTAPPPPVWAGTIEEAVKRWPHSAQ